MATNVPDIVKGDSVLSEALSKLSATDASSVYSKWENTSRTSHSRSASRQHSKRESVSRYSRESISRYSRNEIDWRNETVSLFPNENSKTRNSSRYSISAGTYRSLKTKITTRSKYSNVSRKTSRTQRTPESVERQLLMEMLPHIRQFYENKKNEALLRDPKYNSSEQLVFYPDKGLKVSKQCCTLKFNVLWKGSVMLLTVILAVFEEALLSSTLLP